MGTMGKRKNRAGTAGALPRPLFRAKAYPSPTAELFFFWLLMAQSCIPHQELPSASGNSSPRVMSFPECSSGEMSGWPGDAKAQPLPAFETLWGPQLRAPYRLADILGASFPLLSPTFPLAYRCVVPKRSPGTCCVPLSESYSRKHSLRRQGQRTGVGGGRVAILNSIVAANVAGKVPLEQSFKSWEHFSVNANVNWKYSKTSVCSPWQPWGRTWGLQGEKAQDNGTYRGERTPATW